MPRIRIEWEEGYANIVYPALIQVKRGKIAERLEEFRVLSREIAREGAACKN
jgi:hypothetical protein